MRDAPDKVVTLSLDLAVAARIGPVQWVVAYVSAKIERLRIVKNSVGYSLRLGRPIRRHKPTHARPEVTGAEVIQAGFGVAFFAVEFVGQERILG